MFRYSIFLLVLVMALGPADLQAQQQEDSVSMKYMLEPVDISCGRFIYLPAADIQTFDSKFLSEHPSEQLSTLLSDYANVNIRSYGYSGLTNVSLRGAGSNHTAVLWNGFNIQDPMNGGVNFILFPLYFVDEVQVQKGGSSALFGSGAMGGVISLNNKLSFDKGINAGLYASYGSFENYKGGLSLNLSGRKAVFQIKTFAGSGKNDFPFVNTEQFGRPEMRQQNAAIKQWGFSQENAFLIGKRQKLSTHLWYVKANRELPPNMAQVSSEKSQLDESLRASAEWQYRITTGSVNVRSGLFFNKLRYSDTENDFMALHRNMQSISEAELKLQPFDRRDHLNLGLNFSYEKAQSDQYAGAPERTRTALFASYILRLIPKISLKLSARDEYVDEHFTPPVYSFGAETDFFGPFSFFAKYSTNYRIPTFNDLYWRGGMAKGNPDLSDESSWNSELGMNFAWDKKSKRVLTVHSSAFYSRFTNLIQWLPEMGIWTPVNRKEVLSRGVESRLVYNWFHRDWLFKSVVSYSWVHSTLEKKASNEPDEVLHKQLILTPEHQGNIQLKLRYKVWSFVYSQNIVGKQYVTSDHTDSLSAYTLGNIALAYEKTGGAFPWSIRFRWNNIWNTVYQTMPGYAMPLQNYELIVSIKFSSKPIKERKGKI